MGYPAHAHDEAYSGGANVPFLCILFESLQSLQVSRTGESLFYHICLISISDSVSDQTTKISVLNIERTAQHDFIKGPKEYSSPMYRYFKCKVDLKTKLFFQRIYKLISSFYLSEILQVLKPFSLLILYSQSWTFHQLLSLTRSFNVWSQFCLLCGGRGLLQTM